MYVYFAFITHDDRLKNNEFIRARSIFLWICISRSYSAMIESLTIRLTFISRTVDRSGSYLQYDYCARYSTIAPNFFLAASFHDQSSVRVKPYPARLVS